MPTRMILGRRLSKARGDRGDKYGKDFRIKIIVLVWFDLLRDTYKFLFGLFSLFQNHFEINWNCSQYCIVGAPTCWWRRGGGGLPISPSALCAFLSPKFGRLEMTERAPWETYKPSNRQTTPFYITAQIRVKNHSDFAKCICARWGRLVLLMSSM